MIRCSLFFIIDFFRFDCVAIFLSDNFVMKISITICSNLINFVHPDIFY